MSLKNKKFLLIIIFALLSVTTAIGQNTFIKCITFPGNALGYSVCQTPDNDIVVAGILSNPLLIFKDDSLGNLLWYRTYGNQHQEVGKLIETSNSNFLVCGTIDLGPRFLYLVMINPQGDTLWTRIFRPTNGQAWGVSVCEAPDRGFMAIGSAIDSIERFYLYAVKIDSLGNLQWIKTFRTSDRDRYASSILVNDSSYLILSNVSNSSSNYGYIEILKIDQEGNQIGNRIYDLWPGRTEYAKDIRPTENGYLIVGSRSVDTTSSFLALKISYLLNQEWLKTYKLSDLHDLAITFVPTTNGYWLVGTINDPNYTSNTIRIGLLRINSQGDSLDVKTFQGNNYGTRATDAQLANDSGLIIVGYVCSNPGQVILIKTDGQGNVGTQENPMSHSFSHPIKVFPNPNHGLVNFQISNRQKGNLKIFDALGRNIKEIEIKDHVRLKLSAGIYFYRLKNQTGKIVILSP